MTRRLAYICALALTATSARAQQVTADSAEHSWALRSGPVVYRVAVRGGILSLDYFGPADRESDTTRVLPTYPRVGPVGLVGAIDGRQLDSTAVRFVSARTRQVKPGVAELRVTLRPASAPVDIEERLTAWDETGVITRELTFVNRGTRAVRVDITPTWLLPRGDYTMRYLYGNWGQERQLGVEALGAGARVFEQRSGRSSRGYVPWLSLRNERAGVEYIAELAWSGNWRMAVDRYPGENDVMLADRPVRVALGIRHDGGGPVTIAAGASFTAPRLALTASGGTLDDAANQMHRWQRTFVAAPAPGNRPLLVQFNTWYPFGQDVDITKAKQAADVAAAIGAEVYIVDSGWYVDKDWVLELGDYQVSPRKFPHGLEELSDYVRGKGMKFGLWVEIENVGRQSRMFREHHDWCLPLDGAPVIDDRRCQLDFAKPEVRAWARATVQRLIDRYHLGWIKIDYNINAGDRFDPSRPSRAGERLYDHLTSYYRWLDELRATYPQLVVENCSSGALRFDSEIIAHTASTWVSDVVNAKQSLQLGYGCTLQFAAELCNHWMVGENDAGVVDTSGAVGWWDFMFRVPMTGQFGISSRVQDWSAALRQRATDNVALYKRIRGTITGADVYHLTPAPDHDNPTGWMAMQYVQPADGRTVLLAYRLARSTLAESFRLHGLLRDVTYAVTVDGTPLLTATGEQLIDTGLRVALDSEWRAAVIEVTPKP